MTEHYQSQEQLLSNFYEEMVTVVQKMRNDHLADLQLEGQKNEQIAAISQENLRMDMDELNEAWEDIESNLVPIIEQIDDRNYEKCMHEYDKNIQLFGHKLEEYHDQEATQFTNYQPTLLNQKVRHFEEQLLELWSQDDHNLPQQQPGSHKNGITDHRKSSVPADRNRTVRNVHEMLPKANGSQNPKGQDAFRNLFPE